MRIRWCQLGPFASLPVHAAGIYEPDGVPSEAFSDYAMSSYIPETDSLLRSSSLADDEKQQPSSHYKIPTNDSDTTLSPWGIHTQNEINCTQTEVQSSELTNTVVVFEETDDLPTSKLLSEISKYSSIHFVCPVVQISQIPCKMVSSSFEKKIPYTLIPQLVKS